MGFFMCELNVTCGSEALVRGLQFSDVKAT